jgi:hypothetical protein
MTFDGFECVVGEIRGFRWWRVTPRGWLRSPWHGNTRWEVGANVARCVQASRCYQRPSISHPEGSPNIDCACGFYALHDIPTNPSAKFHNAWELSATTSGANHGLVFGVAGGHGHILVGTTGWRAEHARVLALYLGPEGRRTRRLSAASERYNVPVYGNLEAFVAEWGPELENLVEHGSA